LRRALSSSFELRTARHADSARRFIEFGVTTGFLSDFRGGAKRLDTSSADLGGEPRALRSSTAFASDVLLTGRVVM
jgi:hypothetical protein